MGRKQQRNSDILKHLNNEDKISFLDDLISAVEQSKRDGNFDAIDLCLDQWEATVELMDIPGLKDRAWENYNRLKNLGVIKE